MPRRNSRPKRHSRRRLAAQGAQQQVRGGVDETPKPNDLDLNQMARLLVLRGRVSAAVLDGPSPFDLTPREDVR